MHDDTRLPGAVVTKSSRLIGEVAPEASGSGHNQTEDGMVQDRRQAVTRPVPASRVVSKPVPKAQTQDPREFQLGQIRRRFSPKETKSQSNGSTLLGFNLAPSDPDFPFEMTALECSLSVPASYPKDKASLKIRNSDIPRGFAINVEEGFAKLVEDKPDSTLLELMKALDKSLEAFLSAPKAETIKLVPNKDTRHLSNLPSRSVEPSAAASNPQHGSSSPAPETVQALKEPARVFTATEKAEAGKKREVEVRQLEARLGRLPFFKKSSDGIAFTVQIEPKKRAELPMSIQGVKSVHLFVPLLYPLEPCRIQLDGVDSEESKAVSAGFLQKSSHQNGFSLTAYLNYLAQNMHTLAKTPLEPKPAPLLVVLAQPIPEPVLEAKGKGAEGQQDPDRSHVQYISRPPEWNVIDHEEASESESDGVYSYDSYDSDEDGGVEIKHSDDEATPRKPADNQERGTAISFPFMELYGIELLEVVTLNITVKCERCRDVTEVKGLKDGVENSESCRKCASQLSIRFRKDLVHAHAVRAGFLDLEGCVVGDMLPRYGFTSSSLNITNPTYLAHSSRPAPTAQRPTQHRASSQCAARPYQTSAAPVTRNSPSPSRPSSSCASRPAPRRCRRACAARKKPSASCPAPSSPSAAAVATTPSRTAGSASRAVRRCTRVTSAMMRPKSMPMSGRTGW